MADEYIPGSSQEERNRLSALNDILNDACLQEIRLRPGETVVDFGCGLGQFTRLMANSVGAQTHVVGIERDAEQIAQAQRLAESDAEARLVDFRKGDAADPPLEDAEWGSFDVAHARFLLEHVPGPGRVVAQMAKAVRPGGRVFLCDDDHGSFHPWPEPPEFSKLWQAYVGGFETRGSDPHVGRKLVALLADAGLIPVRNGGVFFGGCAGDNKFEATAANLIAAFLGAKDSMLSGSQLDEAVFDAGIKGLEDWKTGGSSALWYSACFAEARAPD